MYCTHCGHPATEAETFCTSCGTVLASAPDTKTPVTGTSPATGLREQGRGIMIFIFGLLSIVSFGPFLGIPAWIMGKKDLKKISAGLIESSEYSMTKTGMILGIVGTCAFGMIILVGIIIAIIISMANPQSFDLRHI